VKIRPGVIFSVAIAITSGFFVLLGYFFTSPLLLNIRMELVNWAIILAAGFAVLVGIANLFLVHIKKVRTKQKGAAYSVILVGFMLVTFALGLVAPYINNGQEYFNNMFRVVQLPVEKSLMALLAVTLTYASIRLLRVRLNLFSAIFLITALLILLGTAPLPLLGDTPFLSVYVRPYIAQVLAGAGARGILIGVALGTLTTGLRVLFGADRPYGGHK